MNEEAASEATVGYDKTELVSYSINNIYFCVSYIIHIKGIFGNILFLNLYLK